MNKEACKASSKGALASHSWWSRHSASMTRYLVSACASESELRTSRDLLMVTAAEWESRLPASLRRHNRNLMCEHARLERILVDAAAIHDRVEMERTIVRIEKNALAQGLVYACALPGFPEERYGRLLREHLDGFLASIRWHLEVQPKAFERSLEERSTNCAHLARLTVEWF